MKDNTNMHVVIHHQISDPTKWAQSYKNIMTKIERRRLPAGVKPLEYLPSADGRKADCVWEGPSLEVLQRFIDGETTGAARNEYFEGKNEAAMGLPKGEELARAA